MKAPAMVHYFYLGSHRWRPSALEISTRYASCRSTPRAGRRYPQTYREKQSLVCSIVDQLQSLSLPPGLRRSHLEASFLFPRSFTLRCTQRLHPAGSLLQIGRTSLFRQFQRASEMLPTGSDRSKSSLYETRLNRPARALCKSFPHIRTLVLTVGRSERFSQLAVILASADKLGLTTLIH